MTVEQRLGQVEEALDAFERRLGIPPVGEDEVTTEARRLLAIPPDRLRKMTGGECADAAYVLGQFAFRLQQAANREQAKALWAEESIRKIIAKTVNNYKGVSFEERKMQAVGDNDAASALDAVRVKALLRVERVRYLARQAECLFKALMGMKNERSE